MWFNKEVEPEKHYRELIMLFTAWRNEDKDLIGNFSSYQQYYAVLAPKITEQMNQYVMCNEDFNDLQELANNIEDSNDEYDTVALGTENVERQDEAQGSEDLQPDFNENYNLSDDIGIPSVDANYAPLIQNELQDEEYRHMVQMLNKEQKEFF